MPNKQGALLIIAGAISQGGAQWPVAPPATKSAMQQFEMYPGNRKFFVPGIGMFEHKAKPVLLLSLKINMIAGMIFSIFSSKFRYE